MSFTKLQIWNRALGFLKERRFTVTTGTDTISNWLNDNYDIERNSLLEEHFWAFSLVQASVAADATAPIFDYAYRYAIPTAALRIVPITVEGIWGGTPIAHIRVGAFIHTDEPTPLEFYYVSEVTSEALFPATFVNMFALRLATSMAFWMTGKAGFTEQMLSAYTAARRAGAIIDAMQRTAGTTYANDVITARQS